MAAGQPHPMLDDPRPDPNNVADFELPDHQALTNAFMKGLYNEAEDNFLCHSTLLATLPDPSLTGLKMLCKGSKPSARRCCRGMDSRAIATKKRYVDTR